MKKILLSLTVILSLACVLTSCSNDEATVTTPSKVEVNNSEILLQLQTINDSLNQNIAVSQSRGRTQTALYLVRKDTQGALIGAGVGGLVGGILGLAVEIVGVIPGCALGAQAGAVIGGIGTSYYAYKKTCGGIEVPTSYLDDIMGGYQEACSVTVDHDDEADEVTIKVLDISDDLENIGRLHNKTIDYLLASENQIVIHSDPIPEIPEGPEIPETPVFSAFELEVLRSEEYVNAFNQEIETILSEDINSSMTSDGTISEDIMVLYIDAISNCGTTNYDDVVSLTNQYIEIISSSNELSEDEKNNIYIAFAVAVYSYQYWTTYTEN